MSTTVTYKGNQIATVENDTVTLITAGKWVEDDFTLTDVSGSGGGATEYTIPNTVAPGPAPIFDLTSVGLTADDFTLVNTKMWVEFPAALEASANLDSDGDHYFNVTIPAGTIAECTKCSNNVGVFAFSGGSSKPYGFFTLEKYSMDNTCGFLSDGTDPSYGCIVATTGYRTANVGCPTMTTYPFANLFVLHILKLN